MVFDLLARHQMWRHPPLTVIPAKERVKKYQTPSFRGGSAARELGAHELKQFGNAGVLGFRARSSDRPGMTFLGGNNSFIRSKVETHFPTLAI
jgi:hypothetical protein